MTGQDYTGRRGEFITTVHLTRPDPILKCPLFDPTFLGDKYPTVDFLVDILDGGKSVGFFFIQVKATETTTPAATAVAATIKDEKYDMLVGIPVPTFLVGVDSVNERSFIIAATPSTSKPSSIPMTHDLGLAVVRSRLHKEMVDFWAVHRPLINKDNTSFS